MPPGSRVLRFRSAGRTLGRFFLRGGGIRRRATSAGGGLPGFSRKRHTTRHFGHGASWVLPLAPWARAGSRRLWRDPRRQHIAPRARGDAWSRAAAYARIALPTRPLARADARSFPAPFWLPVARTGPRRTAGAASRGPFGGPSRGFAGPSWAPVRQTPPPQSAIIPVSLCQFRVDELTTRALGALSIYPRLRPFAPLARQPMDSDGRLEFLAVHPPAPGLQGFGRLGRLGRLLFLIRK